MTPKVERVEWTCPCGTKLLLRPKQAAKRQFCKRTCPECIKHMKALIAGVVGDIWRLKRAGKPRTGKAAMGPAHPRAKPFELRSPSGEIYKGTCVVHWVREHPELFTPEDAAMIKKFRHPDSLEMVVTSRASAGLGRVVSGQRGQWKGWTNATTPIGDNSSMPASKLVPWTCLCGKTLQLRPSVAAKRQKCSRACRTKKPSARMGVAANGRAAAGKGNHRAKTFKLIDPQGKVHEGVNLFNWVQEHKELFDPADVATKKYFSRPDSISTIPTSRAYLGLSNVNRGDAVSWHGWTRPPVLP